MAKRELREAGLQQTELQILTPEPIVWQIGDKVYEQMPLRLDRLGAVMEEIVSIVLGSGRGAIFEQIVEAAGSGDKDAIGQVSAPMIAKTLVSIPSRLPKIVSLILPDAKEQHLKEHLNARVALAIVKAFIEQNEIGALIQDFFGLVTSVNVSMKVATKEMENLSESGDEDESKEPATEEA